MTTTDVTLTLTTDEVVLLSDVMRRINACDSLNHEPWRQLSRFIMVMNWDTAEDVLDKIEQAKSDAFDEVTS